MRPIQPPALCRMGNDAVAVLSKIVVIAATLKIKIRP